MINETIGQAIKCEILDRGQGDWLYLAEVAATVARYLGIPTLRFDVAFEPTVEIVDELIRQGWFEVGDLGLGMQGFKSWDLERDATVERIRERWLELDEPLSLWDVCWLAITEKGNQAAQECLDSPDYKGDPD